MTLEERRINDIIQKLSITEYKVENLIKDLDKKSDVIDRLRQENDARITEEILEIKEDLTKITSDFERYVSNTDKKLSREITYLKEKIGDLKKDVDDLRGKDSLFENTLSTNEKDKFNKLYQVVIGVTMLIIGSLISLVFQYFSGK